MNTELREAIQTAADALAHELPAPADDGADGWSLGRESWTFHRWFFQIVGRPTDLGEYSHLLRQLFPNRSPELVVAGVFRLAMRDGSPILGM
jgi:hypothetical protein